MKVTDAVAATQPVDEQVLHLRERNKQLESSLANYRKELGERKEVVEMLRSAVIAAQPFQRVPWKTPAKAGKPVIPVLKLSDWHIGEVVNPAETEGFNAFNWEIAQGRINSIVTNFLRWVETMRTCYRIDECRIWREGDLISGDIHHELIATNEFTDKEQTAKAGLLLGECTSRIAAHFAKVVVEGVDSDNHGRTQKKPQAKQKAKNNMIYLAHVIAREYVRKHQNIEWRETEGSKLLAEVAGWKFLIEHGDGVKCHLGIPYYGIERARAREATKRMNTDRTFHYQSCGHWHVAAWVSGNVLINGSLSGTSEYDHIAGRHSPPSQVAFLVHPEHGVFNFTPFHG